MTGRYSRIRGDEEEGFVNVQVVLRAESAKAFKIAAHEDAEPVWVPKSQADIAKRGDGSIVTMTMPEWLAQERGLI